MANRLRSGLPANGSDWSPTLPLFTTLSTADSLPCPQPKTINDLLIQARLSRFAANRVTCPNLLLQLEHALGADTVLCSALDSDPALRLHAAVAAHWPEKVAGGVSLLAGLIGARRAIICIEEGGPEIWEDPISAHARQRGIELLQLHNDYPLADPTLLMSTVIKRALPPAMLPTEHNTIVLDASAAFSLSHLSTCDIPILPVGLMDHRTGRPAYFLLNRPEPLASILTEAGFPATPSLFRSGDLLRDRRIELSAIVGGGELTIHITESMPDTSPDACVRSGWCVQVCPTQCHPAFLLDAAQRQDLPLAHWAGLHSCIECGICAYVCPSRLPLLGAIRQIKTMEQTVSSKKDRPG